MRFVSIASGSSGNCIYAGTEHTHILVDAGISARRTEQGLFEVKNYDMLEIGRAHV